MLGATPAEVTPALAPVGTTKAGHWIVVHGHHTPPRSAQEPHPGDDPAQLATLDLQDPGVHVELWFALHWLPGETGE
ncbi:hypothetical protein [Streptomyces sp. OE57]|uniref:hypothetical protein n=1 Tax=Streptomyces lacaronensis TaxID=3379885 RepID=UPI0039B7434F